jgi:DNA/RNA-binding protein KIN17
VIEQEEKRKRAKEEMIRLKEIEKEKKGDNWVCKDIVVKVMNKTLLGGALYKLKGVVKAVHDKYIAEVEVELEVEGSEEKTRLKLAKLDQDDLETVIPKVGNTVMLLKGQLRGCRAELLKINVDQFNCDVKISEPAHRMNGSELSGVDYEDLSKYCKHQ